MATLSIVWLALSVFPSSMSCLNFVEFFRLRQLASNVFCTIAASCLKRFLHHCCLLHVIPEWFMNHFGHFGGKISRTIKLEAPNGNIYDVGVSESMNRTVLQSGWEAFVDANQIEENYSLMFRYFGVSRFEVTIFDSYGKEKVLCCARMKTASNVQKTSTYCVDISSSSRDATTQSSAGKGSDSDGCEKESSRRYRKSAKMPAVSYSSEELSEDNPSVESDDLQMLSKDYVLSGQCDLTEAQEARMHALVRKIQPKIPVLVVLIKKTNVKLHNDLVIHKDYALRSDESDRGRCNLCLHDFLRDNHVREGDIGLFQPMTKVNAKIFMVTVHLLDNIDYSAGGRTDLGSNHGRTSAKMALIARVKEEPATDGEEIASSEHEEHGVSDISEGASEPPFMLPTRARLTPTQQEKKVSMKVKEIESELPIYVAIMNKTNVCGRYTSPILDFGSPYATKYLGKKYATGHQRGKKNVISLVLQREGKSGTWHTEVRHLSGQTRILRGWVSFSRVNRLRERDLCLFKLMKNEEQLKMVVYIICREKC